MKVRLLQRLVIIGVFAFSCVFCCAVETGSTTASLAWPEVKVENRPGAYWWWMGSAVDKENITWNLETMRKAGMGGGTKGDWKEWRLLKQYAM